jgi:hypothetical protein
MKYALSVCSIARSSTDGERSAEQPPLEKWSTASATIERSSLKPTLYQLLNGWRLPVKRMSSSLLYTTRAGRFSRCATSAAIAAGCAACVSFPPNAPPMRLQTTVTWLNGTPMISATSACTSLGC